MRLKKHLTTIKSSAPLLILLIATLFASFKVAALGLGEIKVFSALNQPLEAEIALNNVRPGEMQDMILRLAPEDAFSRAGVQRIFLLTKLKFAPLQKPNGDNVIVVSSDDIIREPFLNFLVNVEWPRGNLIREYTILLDPPNYAAPSSSVSAPVSVPLSPLQEALLGEQINEVGNVAPIEREAAPATEPLPLPIPLEESLSETSPQEELASEFLEQKIDVTESQSISSALPEIVIDELPTDENLLASDTEVASSTSQPTTGTSVLPEIIIDVTAPEENLVNSDLPNSDLATELSSDLPAFDIDLVAVENVADTDLNDSLLEDKIVELDDFIANTEPSALPAIDLSFDDTISYDEARTEQLVLDFEEEDKEIAFRRLNPFIDQPIDISSPVASETVTESLTDADDQSEVTVSRGDTLWEIANANKAEDIDINQAMLSILRANPEAFIDSNINNLKTGVVLRIPAKDDMLAISRSNALAEAREQNALWREYKSRLAGAPIVDQSIDTTLVNDTTPSLETPNIVDNTATELVSDESIVDEQSLAILAPGAEDQATERATGLQESENDGTANENNLLLAKESVAALQLEQKDLETRLDLKITELEQTESLLQAKNEQLALLQARLAEINANQAAANDEMEVISESALSAENDNDAANETTPLSPDEATPVIEINENNDAVLSLQEELAETNTEISLDATNESSNEVVIPNVSETELGTSSTEIAAGQTETTTAIETDNSTIAEPVTPAPVNNTAPVIPSAPIEPVEKPYASYYRDLPAPLDSVIEGLVDSYGLAGLLAIPGLLLVMLVYALYQRVQKRRMNALPVQVDNEPVVEAENEIIDADAEPDFDSTVIINQEVIEHKPSLLDKIKSLFRRAPKKNITDDLQAASEQTGNTDQDVTGEYEGDLPETSGAFDPAVVGEAAAEVSEVSEFDDEDAENKTGQFLPADQSSEEFLDIAEEPETDDTTAEADVYLAYGLFDQAEDLLKEALNASPEKPEYRAKLLETYFAAGKKDEFEDLAKTYKESQSTQSSSLWPKIVAMGQELLPGNQLFEGENSELKAADFVPSKPISADIDVGDAENEAEPDFDIGEATFAETDLDISENFDAASITIDSMDETIISPTSEFSLSPESESSESVNSVETEVDISADDLEDSKDDDSKDDDSDNDVTLDEASAQVDEMELSEDDTDLDFEEEGLELDDILLGGADNDNQAETLTDDIDFETELEIDNQAGDFDSLDLDGMDLEDDLLTDVDIEETMADIDSDMVGEETIISDDISPFGSATSDLESDIADIAVDDEVETKLDLARAYLDMGDNEGAKSSLEEVLEEGTDSQKQEAETLLAKIA